MARAVGLVGWSAHVRLVETVASRLSETCLEDAGVLVVRVRVEKLDVFADMASVGVEIERERGSCPRVPIDSQ